LLRVIVPLLFKAVRALLFPRIAFGFEPPFLVLRPALIFFALTARLPVIRLFDDLAADLLRVDDLFLVEVVGIEFYSSVR
jgi:hypothetical protein